MLPWPYKLAVIGLEANLYVFIVLTLIRTKPVLSREITNGFLSMSKSATLTSPQHLMFYLSSLGCSSMPTICSLAWSIKMNLLLSHDIARNLF